MRRRILSLAASVALLLPLAFGGTTPAAAGPSVGPAPLPDAAPLGESSSAPNPQVPATYERVGETASLRLYLDRSDSKLIVEDRRSGKLWSSNPLVSADAEQKSMLDDAVFLLTYTNGRRQMTNLASSASDKPALTYQNVQNGVRVTYDIDKLKTKITIDYTIKEDPADGGRTTPYLEATIADKAIREEGDCSIVTSSTCFKVVTIELLPLFGAVPVGTTTDMDGYLMVPDGVGGIVTFKHEHAQYRQRYSASIYGNDAAANAFQTTGGGGVGGGGGGGGLRNGTRPFLPIWGLKDRNSAYAGIVTKGEYQANINAYLAGYITNSNRGSTEFVFRRQASIPRRKTLFVNRIEDEILPGDRQVRYVMLTGDDANYAGMSKAYRDYLMTAKGVKRLPKEPVRPLIDFFMGITRKAAFKEDFVSMVTFDQGVTMMNAFIAKGLKDFDIHLVGWADDGYRGRWPRRYPAESQIGGDAGLRRFIEAAHKNGIRVYLEDEYLFAYTFSSGGIFGQIPYLRNLWPNWSYGFNSRWDTIRGVNKLPVFSGGNQGIYLLNPVIARTQYAERDMPKHKQFGADGINIRSMGRFLMSDTNEKYPLSREGVVQEWMKILDLARSQLGHVMVNGPNGYVIGKTDRIYDSPELSLDAFADMAVPVYHIATQGLAYRTSSQTNLSNDPKTELLRSIEYMTQPLYQLTNQPSSDLIRTMYPIFSSQYMDWIDPAIRDYKLFRDDLGFLQGQFMTGHEILRNRVHRVTYEDGTQVLVNYNPDSYVASDGTVVREFSYTIKKGGVR